MKHRGIEYTLAQGIGRHVWKWSVTFEADLSAKGQAMTKARIGSRARHRPGARAKKDAARPARRPRLSQNYR
jgi:hypothetical protein